MSDDHPAYIKGRAYMDALAPELALAAAIVSSDPELGALWERALGRWDEEQGWIEQPMTSDEFREAVRQTDAYKAGFPGNGYTFGGATLTATAGIIYSERTLGRWDRFRARVSDWLEHLSEWVAPRRSNIHAYLSEEDYKASVDKP